MKKKIISMFTIATLLATSITSVAFAGNDLHKGWQATKIKYEDKEKKDSEHGKLKKDKEKTVTESVYGEDADTEEKSDLENVCNIIVSNLDTKTPDEVLDMLLDDGVSMKKISKALRQIVKNPGSKYPELSEEILEAYSEAIEAVIEAKSDEIEEKIKALEELSDLYDNMGKLEKAINAQKKAIKADYKNILSYKKIGTIFNKKGDKDIKVFTVGEQVYFQDVKPVIKSDRTLVPIRAISESLNAHVDWDEATQTVTITKNGTEIKLVLGNATAVINGEEVKLDAAAETINNRTMVTVRFISEAFKSTVEWEPENQIVIIY